MIAVLLGVVIGLGVAMLVVIVTNAHAPEIKRTINQTSAKIKKKGKILEPESETLTEWLNELPDEYNTK